MRAFEAICAAERERAEPADFGGHDLVALEDWMAERNVYALTLQVFEDGEAMVTLTRRSGQRFAYPLGGAEPPPQHEPMRSQLVAALSRVIEQVEQADSKD